MNRLFFACATALSVAAAVALGVPACGGVTSLGTGGGGGSGSATGSVAGNTLNVVDSVAIVSNGTAGTDATGIAIEILDIPNVCALVHSFPSNAKKASFAALGLVLESIGTTAPPIVVGTYTVGSLTGPSDGGATLRASASFSKADAQCNSVVSNGDGTATGGTVTVTALSATSVTGSYNLTFKNGTLQGTFNAPVCALPDGGTTSTSDGGATCLP